MVSILGLRNTFLRPRVQAETLTYALVTSFRFVSTRVIKSTYVLLRKDVAYVKPSQTLSLFIRSKLLSLKISLLLCTRRFLFFFFYVSRYTYDVLLNPNPLSSAYRVMNRMNLSHSWEERMMYLASMHFGFPFTNFAFTSTCLKLFIVNQSYNVC